MKRIGSVLFLAAGLVALLMVAVVSAAPESPNANALTINPVYQGADTDVKIGEIFTQRVRFERTDATGNLQFEIQVEKSIMFETLLRPMLAKSGSVSTVKVFQTDDAFHWRGSVSGNGFVEIDIPTRVGDCGKPPEDCPNAIVANVLNMEGVVQLTATENVSLVEGDFDRGNFSAEAGFLTTPLTATRSSVAALSLEGGCLRECDTAVVVMANNNPVPARAVIRGVAPAGMKWSAGSPIFSDMDFTDARDAEMEETIREFDVLIEANTTVTLPVNLSLASDAPDGTEFMLDLKVCVEQAGNVQCPFVDGLVDLAPLVYRSQRRDLGDAPDSSNHFATPMMAYAGVPANFPTTADTALAGPHGPVHARPWPLHLGRQVSSEFGADVGPDQDGLNNLEPGFAVPQANLDRADDGVPINLVSFEDCKVAVVPVQIAILPGAVAYFEQNPGNAYLNMWLDGNRDGDWDDVGPCDAAAYEHIVIDHPVDVAALGAGLHTISVTTGLVPWPAADAADAAWMRVTLAEEKSPKLTGLPYGDGRGKGSVYLMGETEDYLYYGDEPGSDGYQPEIEITIEEVDRGDERRDGLATDGREPNIKLRPNRELIIRFRNNGFKPATDLQLEVALGQVTDQILYDSWEGCLTCVRQSEVAQSHDTVLLGPDSAEMMFPRIKVFNIGTLQPQSFGTIVLGWTGCLTCTREADAVSFHNIKAFTPSQEWTKKFERTSERVAAPYIRSAWTGCLTCTRSAEDVLAPEAINGWEEGVIMIVAQPDQTLKFLKNGVDTGQTVIVGPNGIYVGNLPVVPDERTVYQAVAVEGGVESEPSNELDLSCPASGVQILRLDQIRDGEVVDFAPLQPAEFKPSKDLSFLYSEEVNNINMPGYGIFFNRLVYRTCRDQATDLSLNYLGEEIEFANKTVFDDVTVLGWTGCLTCTRAAESTDVTFTVVATPTGSAQGYEYSSSWRYVPVRRGLVVDGIVGKALADVEVMVLRKVEKGSGRHTWVEVGDCVTTLQDGSWSALVPAGEYMVVAKKDGYQPYRSDAILLFDEADALFDQKSGRYQLTLDIKMRPNVSSSAEKQTVDISKGNLGDPVMNIEIGMAVRFVNNGGADTSLTTQIDGRNSDGRGPLATSFDSGQLASGESFEVVFDEPGVYVYNVAGDEAQQGVIVVQGSSTKRIFLPMIGR
ncbi:MAG: hypothetical protein AB8G95_28110 [Anaerolineae bacterium]